MAIQGLRHTENFVVDGRPLNWRAGILLLFPNGKAPLFALTAAMKSRTVDDPEFNWWDKRMQDRRILLPTGLIGTAGTITVTAGEAKTTKEGDIILISETGEQIRVLSVDAAGTVITCTRSWGAVVATDYNPATSGVNPYMQIIGNAMEENSNAPPAVQFDPVKRFNYTQIFRHTLNMSRTAMGTRLRTGDQVKEAKRETLEIHSSDIERALFFGEKIETTVASGEPVRTFEGVTNSIDSTKIVDASAQTQDMMYLEARMEEMFQFGSDEKMVFCGNRGLTVIQQIVRKNTNYQIFAREKEFGMTVTRLVTPYGELVLKTHPLFNQMTGGINTTAYYNIENDLIVLDMANLNFVKFKGGDTRYEQKLQGNDVDGQKSGYLSEVSMELHHPLSHYWLKGLHTAAADT